MWLDSRDLLKKECRIRLKQSILLRNGGTGSDVEYEKWGKELKANIEKKNINDSFGKTEISGDALKNSDLWR